MTTLSGYVLLLHIVVKYTFTKYLKDGGQLSYGQPIFLKGFLKIF